MQIATTLDKIEERSRQAEMKHATRESTKTSLVFPLITALGYDVFDPTQASVNHESGKHVFDLTLFLGKKPVILLSCAKASQKIPPGINPEEEKAFQASPAPFLVLTNGTNYRFHTKDAAGVVQQLPFLTTTVGRSEKEEIDQISEFSRTRINPDQIRQKAGSLLWGKQLKALFKENLLEPSEAFIRFCATEAAGISPEKEIPEEFAGFVKSTYQDFVKKFVTNRLNAALEDHLEAISPPQEPTKPAAKNSPAQEPTKKEPAPSEKKETTGSETTEAPGFEQIMGCIAKELQETYAPHPLVTKKTNTYTNVLSGPEGKTILFRLYPGKKTQIRYNIPGEPGKQKSKTISSLNELREIIADFLLLQKEHPKT